MDKVTSLEKEYCPPLDSALFHAIVLDYDHEDEEQLAAARAILDGLRQSAEIENATGFDASGTGSTSAGSGTGEAARSVREGGSRALTDVTNLTSSAASLNLDVEKATSSAGISDYLDECFEDLQTDQKHAVLAEAFPDLDLEVIGESLSESGFDVSKAIEELLTRRFLKEEGHEDHEQETPKGIEGFILSDERQPRHGKRKRRQKASRDLLQTDSGSSTQQPLLIPQYSKLAIEDDVVDSQIAANPKAQASIRNASASVSAAAFNVAKQEAFAKAAAAARRSRSDHLMGGAASYYASVGRDARAAADHHNAKAADELAARQSTANTVDLHGVDVRNAVRISLEKVQSWWDSGASEWARQGKVMGSGGFGVVTGVGRHSEGGRAKIAPAVRKALLAEGWRIEDTGGTIWVSGKARG